uniref:Uncharacterized protein n=1 Tax=Rhizophora mucronata TaxID=61149 RepID=A0A2P2NXY9_RHIMU
MCRSSHAVKMKAKTQEGVKKPSPRSSVHVLLWFRCMESFLNFIDKL